MKKQLSILYIFFSAFVVSLDAQVEYSAGIGGSAVGNFRDIIQSSGAFAFFGARHDCTNLLSLNGEAQVSHFANDVRYFWGPPPSGLFFDVIQVQLNRVNIITELEYKPRNTVSFGIGLSSGVLIFGRIKTPSHLTGPPSEFYDFNQLTFGFTSKIKFQLKSFYLQVRYLHGLTIDRTLLFWNNGNSEYRTYNHRPLQIGLGYTF